VGGRDVLNSRDDSPDVLDGADSQDVTDGLGRPDGAGRRVRMGQTVRVGRMDGDGQTGRTRWDGQSRCVRRFGRAGQMKETKKKIRKYRIKQINKNNQIHKKKKNK